jgi:hypothetical protein
MRIGVWKNSSAAHAIANWTKRRLLPEYVAERVSPRLAKAPRDLAFQAARPCPDTFGDSSTILKRGGFVLALPVG